MTYKLLGRTDADGWLYEMWPGEYIVTYADRPARRVSRDEIDNEPIHWGWIALCIALVLGYVGYKLQWL